MQVEHEQTCGSNHQPQSARRSEHDGHAGIRVWCNPSKHAVIDRGARRRCETERESVKRAVVQPAAPRPALLLGIDTILASGMQMLESEDVARRLLCSQSPVAQTFMVCARGESTMTYCDSRDDEEANHSEERHHYVVWNDGVEISRLIGSASHKGSRYGCKCQTSRD